MSKHIHRYERIDIGHDKNYWVMKCNLPRCSHYVAMQSKLSCPILKGQVSVCNKCGETFVLNKRAIRMAMPTCDDCVKSKTRQVEKKAEDFFSELEEQFLGGSNK